MKYLFILILFTTSLFAHGAKEITKDAQMLFNPDAVFAGELLLDIYSLEEKPVEKIHGKITQDIYDKEKKRILFPENSFFKGKLISFNWQTGESIAEVHSITVNKEIIKIKNLKIISADLTPLLKGKVYQTEDKETKGEIISNFTPQALEEISKNYVGDFKKAEAKLNERFGAGLQGCATADVRINEIFKTGEKNYRVLYVPRGIKFLLKVK